MEFSFDRISLCPEVNRSLRGYIHYSSRVEFPIQLKIRRSLKEHDVKALINEYKKSRLRLFGGRLQVITTPVGRWYCVMYAFSITNWRVS